jgi:Zn finger protein HypA/HybF involved in hydrogenase expression
MLSKAKEAIRQSRRIIIDNMKLQAGCQDCGYAENAVALDFDHIPGNGTKRFNISQSILSHDWDVVLAEIAKCQIVCSNCHRVREANRRAENAGKPRITQQLVGAE